MLKVKDVNRLKVFGYVETDDYYTKSLKDNSEITIYKEFVDTFDEKISGEIFVSVPDDIVESELVAEELFDLFAANLVERVN